MMTAEQEEIAYIELQSTTNFSFLRGASHPDELVDQANALGYKAIAITDRNTLAGIVRAHAAAKGKDIRIIPACRLDLQDGPSLLAYPTDKAAYGRLSGLLTLGNRRAEKGKCALYKADVFAIAGGIKFILIPPDHVNQDFQFEPTFYQSVHDYQQAFGPDLYIAMTRTFDSEEKVLFRIWQISDQLGVPMVATNDVHYHNPARRELQDVITCIREKCTIYDAGFQLFVNGEKYLKSQKEMNRLFRQYPQALRNTRMIADACQFSLDSLQYVYPREITPEGRTPLEEVTRLAWEGAHQMYGEKIPEKITANILHELSFITEMNYAPYFLTVYDIVREARSRGILCQGRGSAANSTICYCLGITSVDPTKFDLLFERFISAARNEPPDIDVDFEHERREEIIQYVYEKYGRDRAAIVATVTHMHQKGAIRDVGKAMGLSIDTIEKISASLWRYTDEKIDEKRLADVGLSAADPHLRKTLELTSQYVGFPRQLGQHTGGFVITEGQLTDLCPILSARMADRTNIEWNKDDIDALGFLKIDVLALGMLTCIRKCFDLAAQHYDRQFTLANIPQDDPAVYEMISRADTIGVFQIESRAQQSMLPRLRPRNFYDLVIEVAIVRPGPIQGDMVHPYLRRRNGQEPVEYPSAELEEILKRTLGVPLFQEQAMKIAIVAAGFTPAQADGLRRAMATFKLKGMVTQYEKMLIEGMLKNGYTLEYAQRVFKQLEGFGSYGFPESHAASFALLVYVSSWLKCHYPDVFACGLLNSQPMGFYAPAQIVADAKAHGVQVRPVDVNLSTWDNSLEEQAGAYRALRLGFRQVKGIPAIDMEILEKSRGQGYTTITAMRDAGVSEAALELLADADAFRSMGMDRRQALWEITALGDRPVGIFEGQPSASANEPAVQLPLLTPSEHVVRDYAATSLSLKAHPVSFIREQLKQLGICTTADLLEIPDGVEVQVAGLVLVRQRPGTAGGICFLTMEDETGTANAVIFRKLFETYRRPILYSKLICIQGKLQKEQGVIHVVARRISDLSGLLHQLNAASRETPLEQTLSRADERDGGPFQRLDKKTQVRQDVKDVIPQARNFR